MPLKETSGCPGKKFRFEETASKPGKTALILLMRAKETQIMFP